MEPAIIAWLLVVVAPLVVAYCAALGWRELDRRTIGRIRSLVHAARDRSDAARLQMQALLQDAKVKLEEQTAEIQDLRATVDAQSPKLRAAIHRAPRESHEELGENIDNWFTRDEVERRARRFEFATRVRQIESTWFESTADEKTCSKLLCENLWLLEPDLVSIGHVISDCSMETIARNYFPGDRYSGDVKFLDPKKRPDVAGVFTRNDMMTTGALQPERVFVIIEAKAVTKIITPFHMDEAFQYALNLRKMVPALADWNIECYALGGSIAEGVHRQHFRVGPGPHAITVTPITWNFLLQRAKALDPNRIVTRRIDVNGSNPPSFVPEQTKGLDASDVSAAAVT